MQRFPLYLDCQNNHFEVDLLGTCTFEPIPYSHWIKSNTQQKKTEQQPHKKDHFPLLEEKVLLINKFIRTTNNRFIIHNKSRFQSS